MWNLQDRTVLSYWQRTSSSAKVGKCRFMWKADLTKGGSIIFPRSEQTADGGEDAWSKPSAAVYGL